MLDVTQTVVAYGAVNSGQGRMLWGAPVSTTATAPASETAPATDGSLQPPSTDQAPPSPAFAGREGPGTVQLLFADMWEQCNTKPRFKVEISHMAIDGEHVIDLLSTKIRVCISDRLYLHISIYHYTV